MAKGTRMLLLLLVVSMISAYVLAGCNNQQGADGGESKLFFTELED